MHLLGHPLAWHSRLKPRPTKEYPCYTAHLNTCTGFALRTPEASPNPSYCTLYGVRTIGFISVCRSMASVASRRGEKTTKAAQALRPIPQIHPRRSRKASPDGQPASLIALYFGGSLHLQALSTKETFLSRAENTQFIDKDRRKDGRPAKSEKHMASREHGLVIHVPDVPHLQSRNHLRDADLRGRLRSAPVSPTDTALLDTVPSHGCRRGDIAARPARK